MQTQQWSVIGAGASGILAVAKLIDAGIEPKKINWFDPHFAVGDLGAKWSEVPSNTIVKLFVDYLKEMQCLHVDSLHFDLMDLPEQETCLLGYMVEPLKKCCELLSEKVNCIQESVQELNLKERFWHITTSQQTYQSSNVIMATGATPTELALPGNPDSVTLDVALAPSKLARNITADDTIAVFGSSHSAILILKNLVDLNAKKIINFYLEPCKFAVNLGEWILFDNTGLKGLAAAWAKENINGTVPENIKRVYSNQENIQKYLPQCSKVISATGFKKSDDIKVHDVNLNDYQPQTGIIAPGLFGFGIAFPEQAMNEFGMSETKVGLWKFALHLRKVLPIWLQYST